MKTLLALLFCVALNASAQQSTPVARAAAAQAATHDLVADALNAVLSSGIDETPSEKSARLNLVRIRDRLIAEGRLTEEAKVKLLQEANRLLEQSNDRRQRDQDQAEARRNAEVVAAEIRRLREAVQQSQRRP